MLNPETYKEILNPKTYKDILHAGGLCPHLGMHNAVPLYTVSLAGLSYLLNLRTTWHPSHVRFIKGMCAT